MNVLLQSHPYQCLVTATAMVIDVMPIELTEAIGHDGSDWIGDLRRGHHPSEMIIAAYMLGHQLMYVETHPVIGEERAVKYDWESFLASPCVLAGVFDECRHAVAWNPADELIHDPSCGKIHNYQTPPSIEYLLVKAS